MEENKFHVLVVDDDNKIRDLIKQFLNANGFIVSTAANAEEAIQNLIELNNRYAIDGRNPNSYSGIFWITGRFDRAWGPVRPIFGKLRYMASGSTQKKLKTANYEPRFAKDSLGI